MAGEVFSGERRLSTEELLGRRARAAAGFAALGMVPGDAVALMLRNDIPFLEASLAARALSAHAVPINWHYRGDEVGYILRDSGAKALVVHADLLPQCEGEIPPGCRVLVVPTPPEIQQEYGLSPAACQVPDGATQWGPWLEGFPAFDGDRLPAATMFYTSGTTGRPKGVRRHPTTAEREARLLEEVALVFGATPDMRTIIPAPLYHSAPNIYASVAALQGATLVLEPRFDPERLLALIEKHRITNLQVVPTMFVRLLKLPRAVRGRYDLSSLRHVVHAAAPCPVEVKRAMIEWWGPVINEYYASTESGLITYCTSSEWLARPGTVGRAIPHAMVKVVGEEGRELPPGEVGDIYMRSGSMPDFTYHGLDGKRQEIELDGALTYGDMGYLDPEGYLFLCDRKIDMVISGGVNIYPAEIEAVLIEHPQVADCALFGIPDPEYGEALAAAVQPKPGALLSPGDVTDFLRARVAGYKVPRLVQFHLELPREDTGKIFKRRLRARFWEKAGRSI